MMDTETKGTILAFLTALVSGIAIPINKLFVVGIDPMVFTAIRSIIIGLVFLLLSALNRDLEPFRLSKYDWKYLLLIALIGGSVAFLLFFTGLKYTTSGRAAFLHKTLPLYVTLLAVVFLKEKIRKKQWVALGLMMFFIFFDQINPMSLWENPALGDLLVIGATVFWAIENIIAKKVMIKGDGNYVVSFSRMFFGGLILFGVVLLTGKFSVLLSLNLHQLFAIGISTAVLFGYVFFWYSSLKFINVSKAATILLIAPVITMLIGILLFGEPTPLFQLFGSIMVLFGAYFIIGIKNDHLKFETQ
jgi:drug/metabolite transporter (DMT)-like permease